MKTSYVHCQTPHGRSLGFSAKIVFDDEDSGANGKVCSLAITFCNKKDKHFNKKIARAELEKKELVTERCVDVPRLLAEAQDRCYRPIDRLGMRYSTTTWNYILRRFL